MRHLMTVLVVISWSLTSFSATREVQSVTEYSFKYVMNDEAFEYKTSSSSQESAFEKAAQACFTHYKQGKKMNEDLGLDIIDVCANPRS